MTVEVFLLYINEMKSLMKKKVVASAAAALGFAFWSCFPRRPSHLSISLALHS
jgi:hypothetical protein